MALVLQSGNSILSSIELPSTFYSSDEVIDELYEEFETKIRMSPKTKHLYLLGDFNARVNGDHDAWPAALATWHWQTEGQWAETTRAILLYRA